MASRNYINANVAFMRLPENSCGFLYHIIILKASQLLEDNTAKLKKEFAVSKKETPSDQVYTCGYDYLDETSINGDWEKKEPILVKDKPEQKIFINKVFADNSEFGDSCVFIRSIFFHGLAQPM